MVFTLDHDLTTKFPVEIGGGVTIGQEGYFFGYPYGLHTEVNGTYVAFVKRMSVSAIARPHPEASPVFFLDGFNNPGFSGGPVAVYNYKTQTWEIVGVISGFRPENARKKVGNRMYTPTRL